MMSVCVCVMCAHLHVCEITNQDSCIHTRLSLSHAFFFMFFSKPDTVFFFYICFYSLTFNASRRNLSVSSGTSSPSSASRLKITQKSFTGVVSVSIPPQKAGSCHGAGAEGHRRGHPHGGLSQEKAANWPGGQSLSPPSKPAGGRARQGASCRQENVPVRSENGPSVGEQCCWNWTVQSQLWECRTAREENIGEAAESHQT